jgi:hypothetical protein
MAAKKKASMETSGKASAKAPHQEQEGHPDAHSPTLLYALPLERRAAQGGRARLRPKRSISIIVAMRTALPSSSPIA